MRSCRMPAFEVEEIIAEGDAVAVKVAMTGVHTENSWASPPTGKKDSTSADIVLPYQSGKIADSYSVSDMYGMMYERTNTTVK